MIFPERLLYLRKSRSLTQEQLADELRFHTMTVKNYEHRRRNPTFEAVVKIADFFNVSLDYLAGRTDDPTPPKTTTTAQALTA